MLQTRTEELLLLSSLVVSGLARCASFPLLPCAIALNQGTEILFRGTPRPQYIVRIATQITTEFQFIRLSDYDYPPPYFPAQGFSDQEDRRQRPPRPTPPHLHHSGASHGASQRPSDGRNRLHKQHPSPATSKGEYHQVPEQYTGYPYAGSFSVGSPNTGSPNFNTPVQPPPPKQKHDHILSRIFHSSQYTGKRKAVCIGINYRGSQKELSGCVNDAHNIRQFLIDNWHFKSEDILVLTDDSSDPNLLPTKANMLNAMKWLVKDAKAHDSLFFHYSGHGGRQDRRHRYGYDDVIFPLDHKEKSVGIISNDTLNEMLVRAIPNGCRLTALFDSCHSESALDLVYLYHSNGLLMSNRVSEKHRRSGSSSGDVICFSGCEDHQTSADLVKGGLAVGAMSYAFIQSLTENPNQSYQQLLKSVRAHLKKHFSQRPQLSTSHKIDISKPFIL